MNKQLRINKVILICIFIYAYIPYHIAFSQTDNQTNNQSTANISTENSTSTNTDSSDAIANNEETDSQEIGNTEPSDSLASSDTDANNNQEATATQEAHMPFDLDEQLNVPSNYIIARTPEVIIHQTEQFDFEDFDTVILEGNIVASLKFSSQSKVHVSYPDELIDKFEIIQKNRTLRFSVKDNIIAQTLALPSKQPFVKLVITVPQLTRITLKRNVNLVMEDMKNSQDFLLEVYGTSAVTGGTLHARNITFKYSNRANIQFRRIFGLDFTLSGSNYNMFKSYQIHIENLYLHMNHGNIIEVENLHVNNNFFATIGSQNAVSLKNMNLRDTTLDMGSQNNLISNNISYLTWNSRISGKESIININSIEKNNDFAEEIAAAEAAKEATALLSAQDKANTRNSPKKTTLNYIFFLELKGKKNELSYQSIQADDIRFVFEGKKNIFKFASLTTQNYALKTHGSSSYQISSLASSNISIDAYGPNTFNIERVNNRNSDSLSFEGKNYITLGNYKSRQSNLLLTGENVLTIDTFKTQNYNASLSKKNSMNIRKITVTSNSSLYAFGYNTLMFEDFRGIYINFELKEQNVMAFGQLLSNKEVNIINNPGNQIQVGLMKGKDLKLTNNSNFVMDDIIISKFDLKSKIYNSFTQILRGTISQSKVILFENARLDIGGVITGQIEVYAKHRANADIKANATLLINVENYANVRYEKVGDVASEIIATPFATIIEK